MRFELLQAGPQLIQRAPEGLSLQSGLVGSQPVVQFDLVESKGAFKGSLEVPPQGFQPGTSLKADLHLDGPLMLDRLQKGIQFLPVPGHRVAKIRQLRALPMQVPDHPIQSPRHEVILFTEALRNHLWFPLPLQDPLDPVHEGSVLGQPPMPSPPVEARPQKPRGRHDQEGRLHRAERLCVLEQ